MKPRKLSKKLKETIRKEMNKAIHEYGAKEFKDNKQRTKEALFLRAKMVLEKEYPPDEMEILKRHGVAITRTCFCFSYNGDEGRPREVDFCEFPPMYFPQNVWQPHVDLKNYQHWESLLKSYLDAEKEHCRRVQSLISAYSEILNYCQTWEELITHIPEIGAMKDELFVKKANVAKLNQQALMVVQNDTTMKQAFGEKKE